MLDSARIAPRLLFCVILPISACGRDWVESAPPTVELAPSTTAENAGERHVSLESRPSPAAASLLPSGARYRMVATPEEIALVVVTADNRIAGRLRIRPLDRADTVYGSTIVIDDLGGPEATIDAWSRAGGLHGEATVGERRAAWTVRVDADGGLAGERWSVRRGSRSAEVDVLRRARAIGADIGDLTAELARRGVLPAASERELSERVWFAELALDLSVRAWEGRGPATLPRIMGDSPESSACCESSRK